MAGTTTQKQMAVMVLLPIVFLGIVSLACGSSTPPPVSTPTPTPTPIPGYVTGEEDLAYESFTAYYAENCRESSEFLSGHVIDMRLDEGFQGRAVYVGDGIWRFHIQIVRSHYDREDPEATHNTYLDPETVTARSFPDGTWADVCPHAGMWYERDDLENERKYDLMEPDYDAPGYDRSVD